MVVAGGEAFCCFDDAIPVRETRDWVDHLRALHLRTDVLHSLAIEPKHKPAERLTCCIAGRR